MATIINAVSGTGLTQSADASGVLKVQSNGVTTNALAWVNFNGTNAFSPNPSTSAIRAAYNVSSITKNGTGDYTLNFTSALSNANYAITVSTEQQTVTNTSATFNVGYASGQIRSNTSVQIYSRYTAAGSAAMFDSSYIELAIFGN